MGNSWGQPKYLTVTAIALLCILAFCPILVMFYRSLTVEGGLSLAPYSALLLNQRQLELLKNGFLLASGTAIFSIAIGVPCGILISRTDLYIKGLFRYLYLAPLLIPPYISAISWISLLGKNSWINKGLMAIFSLRTPPFSIYSIGGAIWILGLSYFPFVTLLTISGLHAVDTKLEEAASLTHGTFGVIKGITLPLITPYILAGGIFVFIFSFINYGVPALLEVHTYPIEIFAQFSSYCNENAAIAFTLPLILITLALILIQDHYMRRRSYVSLTGKEKKVYRLKQWRLTAFAFVCLIIFLSFFVPLIDLVITAGPLKSYVKAWQTSYMQIGTTLLWAFAAATLIMFLGFFISYYCERTDTAQAKTVDTLSVILFAIPGTVLGIGLIRMWNNSLTGFIYKGSLIIIIAYCARQIPFMIRCISSSVKQIDIELEEAAALTPAGWLSKLVHIVLPLAGPGLIAGWVITFILCLGELDATLLVMPPGKATLAIKIYTLMHYGANRLVAALCIILLLLSLFPVCAVIIVNWLWKRKAVKYA